MSLLASSRQPGHAPLSWLVVPRRQAERLREELALVQDQAAGELRFFRRETIERLGRAIQMHDAETGRHVNHIAALDALLSNRCYRLAMALPEVRGLIEEGRGSHFDPQVLDALLADLGGAACRRGHPGAGVGA